MSMVQLALKRPYTFIVMAILIVLGTPFALKNMATDIFPEINIRGCPEFCVNGASVNLWAFSPQTG